MANKKPRTILLVFIHGFKGDDSTFARFPTGISHALSNRINAREPSNVTNFEEDASYNVIPIVYPAFETRGSLQATVERFRAWLLEKVIDAEVARGTESPTVEPGVGVILVGHSMGGIVGAEAVLGVAGECFNIPTGELETEENPQEKPDYPTDPVAEAQKVPVPEDDNEEATPEEKAEAVKKAEQQLEDDAAEQAAGVEEEATARKQKQDEADVNVKGRLFPKILGLLAFDTPYLGIAPGVFKHNAEEQWQQGKQWYDSASTLFSAGSMASSVFGLGKGKEQAAAAQTAQAAAKKTGWGRTALMAGTGIATLAGGAAAAYAGRDHILSGWNWAGSHLEFIGCLAKEADLKRRFGNIVRLSVPGHVDFEAEKSGDALHESDTSERQETVGFKVMYTLLAPVMGGDSSSFAGGRTFCRVPVDEDWQKYWTRALNDKAKNEIEAHCSMFVPNENTQYDTMMETSANTMNDWVTEWL